MPAGRPSTYTPEIGQKICDAVAASECGLRKTLEADPELPAFATVQGWLRNHAQFASTYAQARQLQIEAMAEDIVDLSNDDTLDPNDKRIRIDTRKWLLSKLIPRTYGDKLDVTSGGEAIATPSHLIDARVQSIIMQAVERRREATTTLSDNALKLLE
jgi:hypothetical protein